MTTPWENNIIYLTLAGSHAYGLNTPESDVDTRGIFTLDREYLFGFKTKNQHEDKENDYIVYSLPRYFHHLCNANPSIIETLYTDEEFHILVKPIMNKVFENRDLFLSKKVAYTFSGYAHAQLKRIQRHRGWLLNPPKKKPERVDFGLPEINKTIANDEQEAFLYLVWTLIKGTVEEARLDEDVKEKLSQINIHGCLQSNVPEEAWPIIQKITGSSSSFIEMMIKERTYKNAINHWKSYLHWKENRNKKRAVMEKKCGYDTKHSSHLIRLMKMGKEILTGEGVIVKRPDREELLSIKEGHWKYEDLLDYANKLEEELLEAKKKTSLPSKINHEKIDNFLIELQEEALR